MIFQGLLLRGVGWGVMVDQDEFTSITLVIIYGNNNK